jgi:hypothetical protein
LSRPEHRSSRECWRGARCTGGGVLCIEGTGRLRRLSGRSSHRTTAVILFPNLFQCHPLGAVRSRNWVARDTWPSDGWVMLSDQKTNRSLLFCWFVQSRKECGQWGKQMNIPTVLSELAFFLCRLGHVSGPRLAEDKESLQVNVALMADYTYPCLSLCRIQAVRALQ